MAARHEPEGHCQTAGFIDVGSLTDLSSGTTTRVTVGTRQLTLVNLDGRVLAVEDLCLRCGRPLSKATLADGLLTCTGCGWKYDVQHGCVEGLPKLQIEVHDVDVSEERLLLASAIAASDPEP